MALLSMGACTPGILYTDITQPLVTNMRNTPNPPGAKRAEEYIEKVTEPLSGYSLQVEVGETGAIGEAARKAGMDQIYYADMRTVSIFGGLYEKRTLIVVGR